MIDNIKILHESDEIVQNPMFIKIKVIQSECDMNFNLKKWNHIFEDVRHDEVIGKPLDKTYCCEIDNYQCEFTRSRWF